MQHHFRMLNGNYLRARGEYPASTLPAKKSSELPPRTRRILSGWHFPTFPEGTTSAHAENTAETGVKCDFCGNYLRARGEYYQNAAHPEDEEELPPRTRRIQRDWVGPENTKGTTSAHAENTSSLGMPRVGPGNYLRARGEYSISPTRSRRMVELPPRTRRIRSLSFLG